MNFKSQLAGLACLASILTGHAAVTNGAGYLALPMAKNEHPRAFFFRDAEHLAGSQKVPYEEWERSFSRLMGIEGKVLEEELPGRSGKPLSFFQRFKKEHPDQLVLLHYNGNARDPRHDLSEFFAGHWIYFNGCPITADVPAEPGETEIRVRGAGLFKTNPVSFQPRPQNVVLAVTERNRVAPGRRSCMQESGSFREASYTSS